MKNPDIEVNSVNDRFTILNGLPDDYPSFNIVGAIMSGFSAPDLEFFANHSKKIVNSIQESFSIEELRDLPVIKAYRQFYWKYCKVDPTKIRPAGEALLRRLIQQGELPQIHPIVDAYNLVSAEAAIPMCAYNLPALHLPLKMRLSEQDELFHGIGMSKPKKLVEGIPVIEDSKGLISIYPYRDADRSKVIPDTESIVLTADGVPGIDKGSLKETLNKAIDLIRQFCGGQVQERFDF
ncbi:MAG: B3/4 domain-containing protein [Candidatus Odinarchaeota archaeon]